MNVTPQLMETIFAGLSLLVYLTATMAGGLMFILRKIDDSKREILTDVRARHEENRLRVDAIQQLVIRHDTLLNPEYDGSGNHYRGR